MTNALAAKVVSRLLAKYIDGITRENIDVSLRRGDIVLTGARIKSSALHEFDLPFDVVRGYVSKLTLSVPWARLKSKRIELVVSELELLAKPRDPLTLSEGAEERRAQAKHDALQAFEDMRDIRGAGSKDWGDRLLDIAAANVSVRIERTHVRIEDFVSNPHAPLSCGFVCERTQLEGCGPDWVPRFVAELGPSIHRVVQVQQFAVYLETRHLHRSEQLHDEGDWKAYMAQTETLLQRGRFMLPMDLELRIGMLTPEGLADPARAKDPRVDVSATVREVAFELSRPQFLGVLRLAQFLTNFSLREKYVVWRPRCSVSASPVQWWRFACRAVCAGVRQNRVRPDRAESGKLKVNDEYVCALVRKSLRGKDSPKEGAAAQRRAARDDRLLKVYDALLPTMELISMRYHAYRHAAAAEHASQATTEFIVALEGDQDRLGLAYDQQMRVVEIVEGAVERAGLKGRVLGARLTHVNGHPVATPKDVSSRAAGGASVRLRLTGFRAGDALAPVGQEWGRQRRASFRIGSATVVLHGGATPSSPGGGGDLSPLASFTTTGMFAEFVNTMAKASLTSSLDDLELLDLDTPGTWMPTVVCSESAAQGRGTFSGSFIQEDGPLICLAYTFAKPGVAKTQGSGAPAADSSVVIKAGRPLRIVLATQFIERLVSFLRFPESFRLAETGLAALVESAALSSHADEASKRGLPLALLQALESRPTQEFTVSAPAPTLVLPLQCAGAGSDALVLVMGQLEAAARLAPVTKARLMRKLREEPQAMVPYQDAYSWFDFILKGLSADLHRVGPEGMSPPTKVLERCQVALKLGQSLVPSHAEVPLVRIVSEVHELNGFLSQASLKTITRITSGAISFVTGFYIDGGDAAPNASPPQSPSASSCGSQRSRPRDRRGLQVDVHLAMPSAVLHVDARRVAPEPLPADQTDLLTLKDTVVVWQQTNAGSSILEICPALTKVEVPDPASRGARKTMMITRGTGGRPIYARSQPQGVPRTVMCIDGAEMDLDIALLRRIAGFIAPYSLGIPVPPRDLLPVPPEADGDGGDILVHGDVSLRGNVALSARRRLLVHAAGTVQVWGRPCTEGQLPPTSIVLSGLELEAGPLLHHWDVPSHSIVVDPEAAVVLRRVQVHCERRIADYVFFGSGDVSVGPDAKLFSLAEHLQSVPAEPMQPPADAASDLLLEMPDARVTLPGGYRVSATSIAVQNSKLFASGEPVTKIVVGVRGLELNAPEGNPLLASPANASYRTRGTRPEPGLAVQRTAVEVGHMHLRATWLELLNVIQAIMDVTYAIYPPVGPAALSNALDEDYSILLAPICLDLTATPGGPTEIQVHVQPPEGDTLIRSIFTMDNFKSDDEQWVRERLFEMVARVSATCFSTDGCNHERLLDPALMSFGCRIKSTGLPIAFGLQSEIDYELRLQQELELTVVPGFAAALQRICGGSGASSLRQGVPHVRNDTGVLLLARPAGLRCAPQELKDREVTGLSWRDPHTLVVQASPPWRLPSWPVALAEGASAWALLQHPSAGIYEDLKGSLDSPRAAAAAGTSFVSKDLSALLAACGSAEMDEGALPGVFADCGVPQPEIVPLCAQQWEASAAGEGVTLSTAVLPGARADHVEMVLHGPVIIRNLSDDEVSVFVGKAVGSEVPPAAQVFSVPPGEARGAPVAGLLSAGDASCYRLAAAGSSDWSGPVPLLHLQKRSGGGGLRAVGFGGTGLLADADQLHPCAALDTSEARGAAKRTEDGAGLLPRVLAITLVPALRIRNALPVDVTVTLLYSNDRKQPVRDPVRVPAQGGSVCIGGANLDRDVWCVVQCTCPMTGGVRRCDSFRFHSAGSHLKARGGAGTRVPINLVPPGRPLEQQDARRLDRRLRVLLTVALPPDAGRGLEFSAPYWLGSYCGWPVTRVETAEGVLIEKLPQGVPVPFMPSQRLGFGAVKLRAGPALVQNSLSPLFPIDQPGTEGTVPCTSGAEAIAVSVTLSAPNGAGAKFVKLCPPIVAHNRCEFRLELLWVGTDGKRERREVGEIAAGGTLRCHLRTAAVRLRLPDVDVISAPADVTVDGRHTLQLGDSRLELDISRDTATGVRHITTGARPPPAPFAVVNNSWRELLVEAAVGGVAPLLVAPFTSAPYNLPAGGRAAGAGELRLTLETGEKCSLVIAADGSEAPRWTPAGAGQRWQVTVEPGLDALAVLLQDKRMLQSPLLLERRAVGAMCLSRWVVNAPAIGLSLVGTAGGERCELFYCVLKGVVFNLFDKVSDLDAGLQCEGLQADCQVQGTIFPVAVSTRLGGGAPAPALTAAVTGLSPPGRLRCCDKVLVELAELRCAFDDVGALPLADFIVAACRSASAASVAAPLGECPLAGGEPAAADAARWLVDSLDLPDVRVQIQFQAVGGQRPAEPDVQAVIESPGVRFLQSIEPTRVRLAPLSIRNCWGPGDRLLGEMSEHYRGHALREVYKLLGAADVLGAPVAVFGGIGRGVYGLLRHSAEGATGGARGAAEGVVKGVSSLVGGVVGGSLTTAKNITGTVGRGFAHLSADTAFVEAQRRRQCKQARHLGDGLVQGGVALARGLGEGVGGIFYQPVLGAKKGGAAGFVKGVGRGLAGVVAKPVSGALDFGAKVTEGVRNTAATGKEALEGSTIGGSGDQLRAPRPVPVLAIRGGPRLAPYAAAEAQAWVSACRPGTFASAAPQISQRMLLSLRAGSSQDGCRRVVCFGSARFSLMQYRKGRWEFAWRIRPRDICDVRTAGELGLELRCADHGHCHGAQKPKVQRDAAVIATRPGSRKPQGLLSVVLTLESSAAHMCCASLLRLVLADAPLLWPPGSSAPRPGSPAPAEASQRGFEGSAFAMSFAEMSMLGFTTRESPSSLPSSVSDPLTPTPGQACKIQEMSVWEQQTLGLGGWRPRKSTVEDGVSLAWFLDPTCAAALGCRPCGWPDSDGMHSLPPPAGSQWAAEWAVDRFHTVSDADGWQYAGSWDGPWRDSRGALLRFRRRRWVRRLRPLSSPPVPPRQGTANHSDLEEEPQLGRTRGHAVHVDPASQ